MKREVQASKLKQDLVFWWRKLKKCGKGGVFRRGFVVWWDRILQVMELKRISVTGFLLLVVAMSVWLNSILTDKFGSDGFELSSCWYLSKHSEANSGYVLSSTQERSEKDYDYLPIEEVYYDKEINALYIKHTIANQIRYEYYKIYLDRYDIYKLKGTDTIQVENQALRLEELDFVPLWRVKIFGL